MFNEPIALLRQQPNLLLACLTFRDKSPFLPLIPAPDTKQTWQQCLRKSVVDIIYPKSGFGPAGVSVYSEGGP